VDDFRLRFGQHELVPIMIGGMGVDISTAELALEAARLGGVGHISDAMVQDGVRPPLQHPLRQGQAQALQAQRRQPRQVRLVKFDLGELAEATRLHVRHHGGQARRRAWSSSTAWKSSP
jgi:nitronate monooxygenase